MWHNSVHCKVSCAKICPFWTSLIKQKLYLDAHNSHFPFFSGEFYFLKSSPCPLPNIGMFPFDSALLLNDFLRANVIGNKMNLPSCHLFYHNRAIDGEIMKHTLETID